MDWVTGLVWSDLIWAGLFWVWLLTVPCSALPVCTQRACYFGSSAEKRWQHHGLLKLLTFPQALPVHPGIYTLVLLLSLLLHMHWLHVNRHCVACARAERSGTHIIRKNIFGLDNSHMEWCHREACDYMMNVCGSSRVQNIRTSQWSLKMRESQKTIERGEMG